MNERAKRLESTMRIEAQEFRRAYDILVRCAHKQDGLTEEEREIVVSFIRALDQEVSPNLLQYYQGPPLATPIANLSLFDEPTFSGAGVSPRSDIGTGLPVSPLPAHLPADVLTARL